MADRSLTRKTARELASLIRSRAVSPVEVLDAHLAEIERLNPKLNAIVTLAADQARVAARAAEEAVMRGATLGPLHGLPVGIKDVTVTAGIRTTFGSPLFKDNVPDEDAEVVRRLKSAGAIVLAKTNTPEFATGANTVNEVFGATRNPWNPELSPAGSSGGSAVAVATGMLPIAQGTDFGCSIRIPAAFCGIVGIRPTPGLTPNYPMPLAWDPGQVHGPLARTAEDAAMVLDAMVGFSRLSPISVAPPWPSALAAVERASDAKGLRIAYASDIAGIGVDAEIDTICRRAAEGLRERRRDCRAGRVRRLRRPRPVPDLARRLDGRPAVRPHVAAGAVRRQPKGNIKAGLKVTALDLAKAEQTRAQVFHRFRELFERYDVLLTPAAPVPPLPGRR